MKTRNFKEDNRLKDTIKNALLGGLLFSNVCFIWLTVDNQETLARQHKMIMQYQQAESTRLEEAHKKNEILQEASASRVINPKNIVYNFSNDNKNVDIDITDTGIPCENQEPYVDIIKKEYPNAKIINRNCDNK